jgi:hypothetical protein
LTIIDQNGGSLLSGDTINILTHDGHYLMAQNSGGSGVDATSDHDLAWEQFKIFKQNGTGAIGPTDVIALQSSDGHYFVAEDGGGATSLLNANRTAIGSWEQFTLVAIPPQCSYTALPAQQTVSSSGGIFSVTLTTTLGCGWTVTSDSSWITITTPADGSGDATVSYSVAPNSGGSRSGTITAAGQSGPVAAVTVMQNEACPSLLTPGSASYASGAGNGSLTVAGSTPCEWTATSNASFVTVTAGASGSGNGVVSYAVAQNTGATRTGTVTVHDQQFTITQAGAAPPNPPAGVRATTLSTTSILVSWTPSSTTGVTGYHVYRRADTGGWVQISAYPVQSPLTDGSLQPGVAYRYKVLAWDGASLSGDSNVDLATTVVFDDPSLIRYQTVVRAIHVVQLRQAIDIVRHAAGWPPATYTDPSLCQTLTLQNQCIGGIQIRKVHVQELRDRLVEAFNVLGLSSPTFTDPTITPLVTVIKIEHIADIRAAVQ